MNVIREIKENKLVGIIRETNQDKAIEIANAYIEGGIKIIEMTTPIDAIQEVAKNENVIVARGGIITREQAIDAIKSNAKFLALEKSLTHSKSYTLSVYWEAISLVLSVEPVSTTIISSANFCPHLRQSARHFSSSFTIKQSDNSFI